MNKKEKYIFDKFLEDIDIKNQLNSIVNEERQIDLPLKKRNRFFPLRVFLQYSVVVLLAIIIIINNNLIKDSSNLESSIKESSLANADIIGTEESNYKIAYGNEYYSLEIINFYEIADLTKYKNFLYNEKMYYIIIENENEMILYCLEENVFYNAKLL